MPVINSSGSPRNHCNKLDSLQPDGSTNFARLASVNLNIEASDVAEAQASQVPNPNQLEPWDAAFHTQEARFDIIITASSLSVLRFSSGTTGSRHIRVWPCESIRWVSRVVIKINNISHTWGQTAQMIYRKIGWI